MLHSAYLVLAAIIVSSVWAPRPVLAQEHVTLQTDLIFYGDNTEFHNPFRQGETIFGTAVRLSALLDLTDRVRIALGGFGNVRFGSEDAFELVRPVIALTLLGQRSSFVFGTLTTPRIGSPPGPDRTGPHGLLPPLQRETLAFDRPYEAGLAWTFTGSTVRHELWIDWQRVNTADHRERFDGGVNAELQIAPYVTLPMQLHVSHEGGQLFASGPVADSAAVAVGVALARPVGRLERLMLEVYGLGSRFELDRSAPPGPLRGAAFFGRASAERAGWRGHLLFWRGKDFITDEGDPNYLSVRSNGQRYRGMRDYAETGVTRTFRPAPGVLVEASGRLHRIEKDYEYSFRVVATAAFCWRVR
jgi:hypothetical protein